ncbi:hypothetical protein [Pseudomonas viridiflava]|uniref:hypothetical protein n=1 Tax=Pseudomonas viridiflava TaxID=33069 RepID=UPI002EC7F4FA|nr:hypothetical protein [Pseudomonas viridiflava]
MSTSLYQEWCSARLSALRLLNQKMIAQTEALMSDGFVQAGVRLESAKIYDVCCRHQRTLTIQAHGLPAPRDVFPSGQKSVFHPAPAKVDSAMTTTLSGLCDLRATIAKAQFAYDELGRAVGVLGMSANRDDLFWMRDECAVYCRRLEPFVRDHQERLFSPSKQLDLVSLEFATLGTC